jgi:primosomal protein N' (replication factor Y)
VTRRLKGRLGAGLRAEVLLDLPIWGLDRPLTYRIPEALAGRVVPGMIVRAPLRGRRVRGWVLAVSQCPSDDVDDGLADLAGVSGPAPVFDVGLLATAYAMARRYVHPLSSFLHLMTPPQMLGRARGLPATPPRRGGEGGATRTLRRLGPREDPAAIYAGMIRQALAEGRGAIVVLPEIREGSLVLERLQDDFGDEAAIVHSAQEPAERSRALWDVARGRRRVVLGGRTAALVPAFALGVVIVHSEGDRTLKEQRAPYYDAREVAEARAAACGADLVLAAEAPSLRSLYRAQSGRWSVVEPPRESMRSAWPVVELLEAGRTAMPRRAVAAVLAARTAGERVLILVPRLAATPSGPGPAEVAAYLRKVAPQARIARADPAALSGATDLERALTAEIIVATEGALADVERPAIGAAVALGVDSMVHRPTGRAAEEAFATLWELACLLARAPSRPRLLLETDSPGHHVVQAVVRGDYHFFARHELEARRASDVPPFSTLIRVRAVRREIGDEVLDRLADLPGTELLGPVEGRLGAEVLLKVGDREPVLDPLRGIVASAGERLLVEMDPREW